MEEKYVFALLAPTVSYFFSLVFIRLWVKHRREWHIFGFAVAFLMAGTGIAQIGLIAPSYSLGQALLFYSICSGGMLVLNWSVAKRIQVRAPIPEMVLVGLVGAAVTCFATVASDDAFFRIYAVEAAIGLQFVIGMWAVRGGNAADKQQSAAVVSFTLPMVLLLASPLAIYAYEGPVDPARYSDSLHWLAVMVLGPFSIVIMSTNILLALSEDLTRQVTEAHQIDYLTGLMNRQTFEDRIEELTHRADELGTPTCIILADIDDFKNVNDTLGHHAGDSVIAAFGDLLRNTIEQPHIVGRVGGEEFCIVLWQTEEPVAKLLANQLCVHFNRSNVDGVDTDRAFSASFGVAERQAGEAHASAYRRADKALYLAKARGKNRAVIWSSICGDERSVRLSA